MRTALIGILLLWLTGCASLFGTPETVTVEKGDTLYSISKRYDMPLRDLIDANGLKPPYTLKVGQVLRLPASTYHIVSRGDTLYSISRQYNVNIADLKRINGLSYPYTLAVGQKVMLAGSARGSSATAANKTPKRTYTVRSAPRKAASRPARSSYTVAKNRKSKFSWPVRGAIVSLSLIHI